MAPEETAVKSAEPDRPRSQRELIHEFRNLMAVVINYCELIADETQDPEAVRADLNEIRVAAERALALLEQLPRPPDPPLGPTQAKGR